MFLPGIQTSKILLFSVAVVAFVASIQLAQAKSIRSLGYSNLRNDAKTRRAGGCAAFGHSCFGGHGKRTDSSLSSSDSDDGPVEAPQSDDVRGFLTNEGPRTPTELFLRDQPESSDLNAIFPSQYHEPEEYFKLSPFFKKWLANSYRRGDIIPINK